MTTFIECLANNAPFDVERVAHAVMMHFMTFIESGNVDTRDGVLIVSTSKAFFAVASDDFLVALLDNAAFAATTEHAVVLWCSIAELASRGKAIRADVKETVINRFRDVSRVEVRMGRRNYAGTVTDLLRGPSASG
jgi:hypothetical protein